MLGGNFSIETFLLSIQLTKTNYLHLFCIIKLKLNYNFKILKLHECIFNYFQAVLSKMKLV